MGTSHVTVNYRNGDHNVSHIYKLDTTVAQQMTQLPPNTTGQQLDKWIQAHGGKLDDKNGIPASVRTYDDGHTSWTSFKDGTAIKHGSTPPPAPPMANPPASKLMAPPASAQGSVGMLSLGGFMASAAATQPSASSKFATASASAPSSVSFSIEADKPAHRAPTTQPAATAPR